eukprot:1444663-Prymnesium_polylepis.1
MAILAVCLFVCLFGWGEHVSAVVPRGPGLTNGARGCDGTVAGLHEPPPVPPACYELTNYGRQHRQHTYRNSTLSNDL